VSFSPPPTEARAFQGSKARASQGSVADCYTDRITQEQAKQREHRMNSPPNQDPLQFLKSLWGPMGIPFAGMITPTLDVGELDKRIGDLKSVQNWLNMNLSMIQATIQGLEMQKATIGAIQQGMGVKPPESASGNPIADAWWDVIQGTAQAQQGKDLGKKK
jgi:hypothetical protein